MGDVLTLENKILKESIKKDFRIKLALCKSAYEIHQPNVM
jgi:hypothetical protein